jgi:putative ABC transport system permease protein
VYGVLAYLVAQRRREISIRMALGSTVRRIVRLVFVEGVAVTALGVGFGVAGAIAVRGQLAALLFGITPTDVTVAHHGRRRCGHRRPPRVPVAGVRGDAG